MVAQVFTLSITPLKLLHTTKTFSIFMI